MQLDYALCKIYKEEKKEQIDGLENLLTEDVEKIGSH